MVSEVQSQVITHMAVASMAFRQGDYHAALRNLNIALYELNEAHLNLDEEATVQLQHLAGKIYMALGMLNEAEQAFQKSINAQAGDGPSKQRSSDLRHLAETYRLKHNYARAIELYRQAIDELADIVSETALAKCHMGLGQALIDDGQLEEAEERIAKALDSFENNRGQSSFWYGRCLMVLARLRYLQGKLAEAEEILCRGLATIELLIGPHHPLRARALMGLSKVLTSEGDTGQGEESLTSAMAAMAEIDDYLKEHDV